MSTNICAFLFLYLYIVVVYVLSKTFRVLFCLFQIDVLLCFTTVAYEIQKGSSTKLCKSHTPSFVTVVYFVPLKES